MTVSMGEMCRTLREQAGVSLRHMAQLTHRDTSTLSRFERGHSQPRDIENLVRAYRELLPQTQHAIQHSNRPRLWALIYIGLSPVIIIPLTLAGPAAWDSHVMRTWTILSLVIISAAILPTIIRDVRQRRHMVPIFARAAYVSALIMIATSGTLRWNHHMSPIVALEAFVVVALGMICVAYDRLERENAPAE